jgi:hypothetical protein
MNITALLLLRVTLQHSIPLTKTVWCLISSGLCNRSRCCLIHDQVSEETLALEEYKLKDALKEEAEADTARSPACMNCVLTSWLIERCRFL